MKLLCITDLHSDEWMLEAILQEAGTVDAVLFGGDLTHFGTPNTAESLVRQTQAVCPTVLAVAGNCDSAAIDERLAELEVSLMGRCVVRDRCAFVGVSAMPPWIGGMYELTEDEIGEALENGWQQLCREPRDHAIVLSHTPPWNTRLDRTSTGQHVGSRAVRAFIERYAPALVVCGHIHEARGIDRMGATRIVNCGAASHGHYAIVEVNPGVRIELRSAGEPT